MLKEMYSRIVDVGKYFFEVFLIVAIIAIFGIGAYVIVDTYSVVEGALPTEYEVYKPAEEDSESFEELVEMNPDVIGWITIYGTNVDYPVVQGEDNNKYLKTSVKGEYSLSGSIFMDYRNKPDFSDFNTIIYGHNMAYNAMFGDVSDYVDKEFFDKHKYGNLFYGGRNHGIEVKAFIEADVYKTRLYVPGDISEHEKQTFVDEIYKSAMYTDRERITTSDRVVLLSTCTSDVTNGRHILIAELTDEVFEDTFAKEEEQRQIENVDSVGTGTQDLLNILIILAIIVVLSMIAVAFRRAEKRREKRKQTGEKDYE